MNETPWLGHYDPGVPATLAPVSRPHAARLRRRRRRARGPAIRRCSSRDRRSATRALDRLSDACAAAFAALGIGRGDRVALLLPNCPQFFIAELGAWKIGAIVAPLNPDLRRARDRGGAPRTGRDRHRHPDALLPARQTPAAADAAPARHRDQHQGPFPAAPARRSSRCFVRRRTAIGSRIGAGDHDFGGCCGATSAMR